MVVSHILLVYRENREYIPGDYNGGFSYTPGIWRAQGANTWRLKRWFLTFSWYIESIGSIYLETIEVVSHILQVYREHRSIYLETIVVVSHILLVYREHREYIP